MYDTVPDLVFNELKFLRDPHEHQDESHADSYGRGQSHIDKKREAEREEISAYFNQRASRDNELGASLHRRVRTGRSSSHDGEGLNDLPEGGSSPILPDKELTAIPYLGFGSRGTVNQSGNLHSSTTTYLTWSESAAGTDTQTRHTTKMKATGKLSQISNVKKAPRRRLGHDLTSRPPSGTAKSTIRKDLSDVPRGQWSRWRRTRGPAHVEVYIQQNSAEHDPSTGKRNPRDSTSVSLPTRPPAESARRRQQEAMVRQQTSPSDVGSFNTSDILKVRHRLGALAEEEPISVKSVCPPLSDKENVQPTSSSPTAKILRIAHEAMAKSYEEPVVRPLRDTNQIHRQFDKGERGHVPYALDNASRRPNRAHARELVGDGSTYRPLHTNESMRGQGFYQQVRQDTGPVSPTGSDSSEDEMLDGYTTFEPTFDTYNGTMPDRGNEHTHALPEPHTDPRSLSFRFDRPSTRARGVPWSRSGVLTTYRDTSSHDVPAEQVQLDEDDHTGGREFEDGLEGFWRPNRLY